MRVGWAALTYCIQTNRLMLMQMKNITLTSPGCQSAILVLDLWGAYCLDYKNERPRFVDAFWNIINWNIVKQGFLSLKLFLIICGLLSAVGYFSTRRPSFFPFLPRSLFSSAIFACLFISKNTGIIKDIKTTLSLFPL